MNIFIFLCINLTLLLIFEKIISKSSIKPYLARKLLHLISALIVFWGIPFVSFYEYIFLTGIFAIYYTIRYFTKPIIIIEISEYTTYGSFLYPISLFVMGLLLFDKPYILQLGMLILGIPDVIASIIDYRFNKKTIWGRALYFIVALVIIAYNFELNVSIYISFTLTIIEGLSKKGLDNLSVPLIYSLIMRIFYF